MNRAQAGVLSEKSPARRAAGVTPAPSEKRKVARGALLCSQGGGSKSGPSVNPDRASIAKVGWTGRETELPEIAMMRRNLTPNPFPHGKGRREGEANLMGSGGPDYQRTF